ncbi:hypothetical protein KC328_g44 [Hortaea werneckii]|nr:hypothetical protein KC328_g44 [Hortaea werneckii]
MSSIKVIYRSSRDVSYDKLIIRLCSPSCSSRLEEVYKVEETLLKGPFLCRSVHGLDTNCEKISTLSPNSQLSAKDHAYAPTTSTPSSQMALRVSDKKLKSCLSASPKTGNPNSVRATGAFQTYDSDRYPMFHPKMLVVVWLTQYGRYGDDLLFHQCTLGPPLTRELDSKVNRIAERT